MVDCVVIQISSTLVETDVRTLERVTFVPSMKKTKSCNTRRSRRTCLQKCARIGKSNAFYNFGDVVRCFEEEFSARRVDLSPPLNANRHRNFHGNGSVEKGNDRERGSALSLRYN